VIEKVFEKKTKETDKTKSYDPYTLEKDELLEQYDQTPKVKIVEKSINLLTTHYTKTTANDKTKGFIFTENLQAYLATRNRIKEVSELPRQNKNIKLDVTSVNNQAGIRFDRKNGTPNTNAFAIITKKYQQNNTSDTFVAKEGQFNDTDSDFALFKKYNEEAITEALSSGLPLYVPNVGLAVGKSALPLRFATWLQQTLFDKLGVNSSVIKNTSAGYEGYGLSDLTIRPTIKEFTRDLSIIPFKLRSSMTIEMWNALTEKEKLKLITCS
jgi:hypothetical protein